MRSAVDAAALAPHRAEDVEVLADVELDAQLVPDLPRRQRGAVHELVGVDEGQVADEDGHALAEAPGLARPALRGVGVGEAQVGGPGAPPGGGAVHHVVVEQGEGVQQLERRAGVDRAVVGRVAAGGDEAPVAERRPQPLAARGDEATERLHRRPQIRVQRRPAGLLHVDQLTQPGVDAVGDLEERRGGRRHRDRLRDVRDSSPTEPRGGEPPGGRPCGRGDGSTPSGVLPSLELLELGPITSCSGVRLP